MHRWPIRTTILTASLLAAFSRGSLHAADEEIIDEPSTIICADVECESFPNDGNCSAAEVCCGCDEFAPGGQCYLGACTGGEPEEPRTPPIQPAPPPGAETSCNDGQDNDGDGSIDCEDSDCLTISSVTATVNGAAQALDLVDNPFQFAATASSSCVLPQLEISWNFDDGTASVAGATQSRAFTTPDIYQVTATATCAGCTPRSATVFTNVVRVTIESPADDPAGAGEPDSEFVFKPDTAGNVGVEISVRARVEPVGLAPAVAPALRWRLERGGTLVTPKLFSPTTDLEWETAAPEVLAGSGLANKLMLRGYPAKNDRFGAASMVLRAQLGASTPPLFVSAPIELFYDKTARQGAAPNWLKYWLQVFDKAFPGAIGTTVITHQAQVGNLAGATVGMMKWQNQSPMTDALKYRIDFYDLASKSDTGKFCSGNALLVTLSGIDLFVSTMLHELVHIEQIRVCDAQIAAALSAEHVSASGVYLNGWSWNTASTQHNHVTPGGVVLFDESLRTSTGAQFVDWCTDLGPAPRSPWAGDKPTEQAACETRTTEPDTFKKHDWSAPGKNYRDGAVY